MSHTIYASFADPADAERAVGALLDHGLKNEQISLAHSETYARSRYGDIDPGEVDWNRYGSRPGNEAYAEAVDREEEEETDPVAQGERGISTTTGGDAAVGAAKGAGVGLGVGALAALATLFIPGVGLVTGAGALATALGAALGATAAGAAAGGVYGYLKDQGVDDQAARDLDETFRAGGSMIEIHHETGGVSEAEIAGVLRKYNATSISGTAVTV